MRQKRRSYREHDDDEVAFGDDLASVNERLDELTRQLERVARANAPSRGDAGERAPDRVADALARLDRRLDQVIQEGRAAAGEFERARHAVPPQPMAPPAYAPPPAPQAYAPPPPAPPSRGPANWAAQISARQRALEGGAAPARAPLPPAPAAQWVPPPDFSSVEQQLRHLTSQISSLHQPYESALDALRGDLAAIGRALTDAMPRRAIEALEGEVHALSEKLDRTRQAGAGSSGPAADLSVIEQELTEVRHALQHLTPAENLGGFQEAVQALSHKIDQIAASTQVPNDPLAFKQLEQAVVSLRGVVSNVASDGALSQLAAEVHGLGQQFERVAAESSADALGKLEARIGALMESGRAVPPELEGSIRALSERLDRMQLSQGDQLAITALEDRIAKLSEKLDASDTRLGQLDAIERGLADLLVHLEEMRSGGGPRGFRAPQPPEPSHEPAQPTRPAPAAPAAAPMPAPAPAFAQSPLDLIPEMPPSDAPAMQFEPPVAARPLAAEPPPRPNLMPPAPLSETPRPPKPMPPRGPLRPIDPNLPPDTPLEPGSGVPRVKPGSAAARIAASEAALGTMRHAAAEPGGKSAAIAAARNAAKAAYLDTPVKVPKSLSRKPGGAWFKRLFKKKDKDAVAVAEPVLTPPALIAPSPAPQPPAPPPVVEAPAPPAAEELSRAPIRSPSLPPMPVPKTIAYDDVVDDVRPSRGRRILKLLKTLLIAASVAIIVVGTVQTAIEFLFADKPATTPATPAPKDESKSPSESKIPLQPKTQAPATVPSRSMPAPGGASIPAPGAAPDQTNSISGKSFFDPSTVVKLPDVTNSIPHKPVPPKPPAASPAGPPVADTLPASISPMLRTAALANDAGAEYELGARYAEGRGGITQNAFEAAHWFKRAADAGFAPAQFRLASLHEKGEGVSKDLQAARRLYLAAAEKGHAKAMHNLAVLYAEGIDGKPDYKLASDWFRKAATYGVTDSQFNLAILYARGIGVQTNLAESYRWFALAAASGDQDAAKKRDEVAARLDQQALNAAKVAAQSFVPEREPEEATSLKAPPGGWDHAPAQPAKPRRPAPAAHATPAR